MIPSTVRIYVCSEPQDMRGSFDRLSLVVKERLGEDAHSGALFCFVNKRHNRLKVLWRDIDGMCILYKRLHGARFILPDNRVIDAGELARILRGVKKDR